MGLDNSAKLFIFIGLFFLLLGLSLFVGEKIPFLGRLPGDIVLEKKDFKLYFPLATCILLSVVLTLFLWFLGIFFKR